MAPVNQWLHDSRDKLIVPSRERSLEMFGDEMLSRGLSDPAAGAGELDRFVAVGGAELGGC
jgi:hypothetical protein